MDYPTFIEAYNWIAMYKHGYDRLPPVDETKIKQAFVWDCENENWIDYVEKEKDRYRWSRRRNAYELPKGA